MTEAESMTGLMQRGTEDIRVSADLPAFVVVEMHVAGNRLDILRNRVESMCDHAAGPVEWVPIPVGAAPKQHRNRPSGRGIETQAEGNLDVFRPLIEGSHDFGFHRVRRSLLREANECVFQ